MTTPEESVLDYIKIYNKGILYFREVENELLHIKDVDDLVDNCMTLLREKGSYRILESGTKYLETHPGKFRSSLDIWRHILAVRPEITIFEVMNSIYNIRDRLYGQYCSEVHRRVFKIHLVGYYDHGLESTNYRDEYNLLFKDWENIGKSNE